MLSLVVILYMEFAMKLLPVRYGLIWLISSRKWHLIMTFLDLWRGKIQFHILVNVDSNAWKFFICISSNSNFTKRQHSSTLLFSQVFSHKFRLLLVWAYIFSALFFCGAVFGSNHALQYLSYPSQVKIFSNPLEMIMKTIFRLLAKHVNLSQFWL